VSGARRIRLSALAERDLEEIANWTALNFGAAQAERYMETLALAVEALTHGPNATGAKQRDELAPGVLTLHAARRGKGARHFIVFRAHEGHVEVLRVLHDSMEPAKHLPNINA